MTARPVCAVCLSEMPHALDLSPAETTVGPLAVCGSHVDAALAKLGYSTPTLDIVGFLELIDPQELQDAALERIDTYEGDAPTGRAFLGALIDAVKEQSR